jgi:TatD DNase family protein
LRDTLDIVSDDKLLLETDAPYLSPEWMRWTTNHPANLTYIYDFVANQKKMSLRALQTQVEINFKKVYKLA